MILLLLFVFWNLFAVNVKLSTFTLLTHWLCTLFEKEEHLSFWFWAKINFKCESVILSRIEKILTAHKRNRVEFIPPLMWDLNRFCGLCVLLSLHAQIVCVLYNTLHIAVLHCVGYVPEVIALRKYLRVIFVRHKLHESFILTKNRPELSHA